MSSEVERTRLMFNNKIRWKVYNKELIDLKSYRINFFKYMFFIKDEKVLKSFVDLVTQEGYVPQHTICNFLLEKKIKYKLRFHYLKEATLNENWRMFLYVIRLNIGKLKVQFNYKYYVEVKCGSKDTEGKQGRYFILSVLNFTKMKSVFFQIDSNIWWLPKIKVKSSNKSILSYFGWLFFMIGTINHNPRPTSTEADNLAN